MITVASNEFYDITVRDKMAILDIKEKVFDFITDVQLSDQLIDFIRKIDYNPDVNTLIFVNDRESFSEENYERFIKKVLVENKNGKESDPPCYTEKNVRFREINVLNNIIKTISKLQKLVISGLNGTIVTPFFGASLVADFRYASDDAVFSMIHNKHGLHPSGGLPYFLSSYLHHSKALEIQLKDEIDVQTAFELGLVTKILPKENFREQMIAEASKITSTRYCSIRDTKRLTNWYRKSLVEYFEFEGQILNL